MSVNDCLQPPSAFPLLYERELPDGRVVSVVQQIFSRRVVIGGREVYDDGWCYPNELHPLIPILAAHEWDGEGDPPLDGWVKHVSTGRRRPDGDPEREYVAP